MQALWGPPCGPSPPTWPVEHLQWLAGCAGGDEETPGNGQQLGGQNQRQKGHNLRYIPMPHDHTLSVSTSWASEEGDAGLRASAPTCPQGSQITWLLRPKASPSGQWALGEVLASVFNLPRQGSLNAQPEPRANPFRGPPHAGLPTFAATGASGSFNHQRQDPAPEIPLNGLRCSLGSRISIFKIEFY